MSGIERPTTTLLLAMLAALLVAGTTPAAAQSGDPDCPGADVDQYEDCDSTVVIILPPLPAPSEPGDDQYGGGGNLPGEPSGPDGTPGNVASPLPGESPNGTVSVEISNGTVVSFDKDDIIRFIEVPSGNDGRSVILPDEAVTYIPAAQAPESLESPSGARLQSTASAESGVNGTQQAGIGYEGSVQEDQPQLDALPDTGGSALPLTPIALTAFGVCAAVIIRVLSRAS